MNQSRRAAVTAGILTGALGGYGYMAVCHVSLVAGPLGGAAYGLLFGYLFARHCGTSQVIALYLESAKALKSNPGAGLVWGRGYAFLLWLAIPAGILPVVAGAMPSMGNARHSSSALP
jgi:hypothetical protein